MLVKRPATLADYDFLYALHKAAMKEPIAQTWGWDETWQQNYFQEKFNPANRWILQWQDQDVGTVNVGTLSVEEKGDELYLALIELLPEFQGRGWGTAVIQELILQAQEQNKTFSLHVLKKGHRAKKLYERLGLKIVADEAVKYKMQLAPHHTSD